AAQSLARRLVSPEPANLPKEGYACNRKLSIYAQNPEHSDALRREELAQARCGAPAKVVDPPTAFGAPQRIAGQDMLAALGKQVCLEHGALVGLFVPAEAQQTRVKHPPVRGHELAKRLKGNLPAVPR